MRRFNSGSPSFGDYAPVAERVTLFYERYPRGRILTQLHSRTELEITFRALVFRDSSDARPAATGWASERNGDGEINEVACLENAETSAIGRALANLGFTASSNRPSREEMEKASRVHTRVNPRPLYRSPSVGSAPRSHPGHRSRACEETTPLQAKADAVTDLLLLLRAARHSGLRERRAEWIEVRARDPRVSARALDRLGRRLRRWIAASVERRLAAFPEADDI